MLSDFEEVLGRLNVASRNGEKAMCFCPAHDDRNNPSLSLKAENGRLLLHCFAGCRPETVVSEIGLELKDLFAEGGGGFSIPPCTPARLHAHDGNPHANAQNGRAEGDTRSEHGCTLEDYSAEKKLPEEFLRGLGLKKVTYMDKPAVRIPYPDEEGQEVAVRFRVSLNGGEKFRWRSGDKPHPYGLGLLKEARKAGYIVLVEGESDCHALWYHEIPALGIPGASNWRDGWATYLDGIKKIYAVIEREGPTGLIVTTTAVKLHPENETRLLSLTVTDTQEQTRAVMGALAEEAGEAGLDLEAWHALQVWLESAEHGVSIPYAKKLAELIPPVAVRLRRDFGAVLNLIRAHAILHQATREGDAEGRIVATIEDYARVRELVADLVSEGIEATVPATVRETVEAVKRLREDSKGEPVTVTDIAKKLKLDRSAVSRRVRNAKDRGYLRDLEENRRKPSRLVPGDDLPEDLEILPKLQDVRAGVRECASGSARLDGPQKPHSDGQKSDDAYKACSRARVQEGIKDPLPPRTKNRRKLATPKTTSSKRFATCSPATPRRRYEGSYRSSRAVQRVWWVACLLPVLLRVQRFQAPRSELAVPRRARGPRSQVRERRSRVRPARLGA